MLRVIAFASLIAIATLIAPKALAVHMDVIYGADNRHDYFEVADPFWRSRADGTVALLRAANVEDLGDGTSRLRTSPFGTGSGLCASEPYYEQETAAFCSGFLVTPDTIVTAGHCVRTQVACDNTRFVFGFRLEASGAQPRAVPTSQVFSCARLVHAVANPSGEDFAVVKLDRPVTHAEPVLLQNTARPPVGTGLVVMGHPSGLPLKIADGAEARVVRDEYMVANLDTYGGNSGSAVFNALTGEVEGILVRGEMDYIYKNGCRVSNICVEEGCRGEDVTLIERVRPYLGN
ncbi:MAG TPA: serine protease [Bdellovibrionales bacterium]|nr:serine protease [Bdellovibrionales bacterium]